MICDIDIFRVQLILIFSGAGNFGFVVLDLYFSPPRVDLCSLGGLFVGILVHGSCFDYMRDVFLDGFAFFDSRFLTLLDFVIVCQWLLILFAPSLLAIISRRFQASHLCLCAFITVIIVIFIAATTATLFVKMSSVSDDAFLDALEEEARVGARMEVELEEGEGRSGHLEIVRGGGVQVPDTIERDLANRHDGEMIGSNRIINDGDDSVAPKFSEWKYSTEAQRDLVAKGLVAVSLFSIGWDKFPNMYVCQIVRMRGVVDFVLVVNAINADSILDALGSRLKNKSILFWCADEMVRSAGERMLQRKGVCMSWNLFDPEQVDPPRWPCFRGDSVLEACEPVKRFVEALGEWKERNAVPRVGELEGTLEAVVDQWEKEERWSKKRDTWIPEWPVWMPAKVWGCPPRLFRPSGLGAAGLAVGEVVAAEAAVVEEDVVVPMDGGEDGEMVVADPELAAATAKVEKMREKRRLQHQRERAKKREARDLVQKAQEKEKAEAMARIAAKEKELAAEKAKLRKGTPPKKQKVETRVEAGEDVKASAGTEPPIPRRNFRPPGRGSGRGNWRGHGGQRRDHGGFRQNQSLEHEEVMLGYRARTPSLANASMTSSSSLPSLSLSDPNVLAGLSVLGMAFNRPSPAPVEPVATSSPVAYRQPRHQSGGGQRQQSSSRDRQQRGPSGQPPQQQQQQQQGSRSASRPAGGRGGAPPRQ